MSPRDASLCDGWSRRERIEVSEKGRHDITLVIYTAKSLLIVFAERDKRHERL